MNIEDIREYCLLLPGTTESFPFDEVTLVFKVMGKMFCLTNLDGDLSLSLKNAPDKIIEMREQFSCVLPGYHMSKTHWNLVLVDGSVQRKQLEEWINESYNEVVSGLTKKLKQELQNLNIK